jgi:hypothetical protein
MTEMEDLRRLGDARRFLERMGMTVYADAVVEAAVKIVEQEYMIKELEDELNRSS